jgi:hypothetical protein
VSTDRRSSLHFHSLLAKRTRVRNVGEDCGCWIVAACCNDGLEPKAHPFVERHIVSMARFAIKHGLVAATTSWNTSWRSERR